jgi:hypothetical protein
MEKEEKFFVLQIDHPILDFSTWKGVFEHDPAHRKESGVRRHRISRVIDDPDLVTIDLEFSMREDAEAFYSKMRGLWSNAEGKIIRKPYARIIEVVESSQY